MKYFITTILITQALFCQFSLAKSPEVSTPSLDDIISTIEEEPKKPIITKDAKKYKDMPTPSYNREIVCTKSFRSNFRKGPSVNFPIEYEILVRGYPLQVIKYVDTWYAVQDFEGTIAWISGINVKKNCGAIVKSKNLTSVYIKPSEKEKVVMSLERGFIIHQLECFTKEWCEVTINDIKGWVKKENLWGKLE